MAAPDKKKLAALIIGMKPKPDMGGPEDGSPDMGPGGGGDDEPDTITAAHEIMSALKSGDAAGFADSLKAFVKMCDYEGDEGEGEEGPPGM